MTVGTANPSDRGWDEKMIKINVSVEGKKPAKSHLSF